MNKLIYEQQKVADRLEPVIKGMKPERASELSELLGSLQHVAEVTQALRLAIENSKPLEDADCARYAEGLNERDAKILREWLQEQAKELELIYYHLGIDKESLYERISSIAIDVWNDAIAAEIAAKD
jgi:transcriptional regulator with PAS, ATPase and Fis domain